MKRWILRLSYGILFAIPMMLVSYALAQAANRPAVNPANQPVDCTTCHAEFFQAWQVGAHGRAYSDPAFLIAWQEKGSPEDCLACHVTGYDPQTKTWQAEGITCTACHGPIPEGHPMEPMPADRNGKVCGDCHTETYFEWQVSDHAQEGINCASCHDPHATALKFETAGELCASCHQARYSNFTHTRHSQAGLACDGCHLTELKISGEGGHARRDHSFFVSLTACNNCHMSEMHDAGVAPAMEPTSSVQDAMNAVQTMGVTSQPAPVSPLGPILLAGLVGVALGVVAAPWLERVQGRGNKADRRS